MTERIMWSFLFVSTVINLIHTNLLTTKIFGLCFYQGKICNYCILDFCAGKVTNCNLLRGGSPLLAAGYDLVYFQYMDFIKVDAIGLCIV